MPMELFMHNCKITQTPQIKKVYIKPERLNPNHYRGKHGILFVLEGSTGFYINDKLVTIDANQIAYLPKGLDYGFNRDRTCVCIVVDFECKAQDEYSFFSKKYQNAATFKDIFSRIYRLHCTAPAGYEAAILSDLYRIISMIQENESASYVSKNLYKKIEPSIKYLNENFLDGNISTPMLAKMSDMSTRYYTMLFNSFFRCSPKKYIIDKKIDMAKNLICSTDMSINKISEECRFYDVYYFCKQFKKATHMSPTEYRKNNSSI